MQAIVLTIGDEILIGQVVDTNSSWIARELNLQGVGILEMMSVSDSNEAIISAIKEAFEKVDLVLMTGGLGPTKDDITTKAIAEFYGVELFFHQPTYDHILKMFERMGKVPVEAHRLQCYLPENVTILENKMGSAPGMWFDEKGKVLVSMPGVPYEMEYVMSTGVLPRLKNRFTTMPIAHRTILTVGEGESRIAMQIEDFENNLPPEIRLAYLPGLGQVRLRLTAKGNDEQKLNSLLDKAVNDLKKIIPEFIFGYDHETLEEVVGKLLIEKKLTLATAESCTGGFIAHKITSIAGSSEYFKGSIVAYANELKMQMLDVLPVTIENYGAVSEATVIEMVNGVMKKTRADVALSVSGIAGPTGGTPEKPVGTIWLAIGDRWRIHTEKLQLGKNRLKNIEYATVHALNMIRKFLLEQ